MITRRQLIARSGATGAAIVLAPQAARAKLLRGGRFRQGVLSGDPTAHGITLLTLVDDVEGRGTVRLEVARDPHFRHAVARKSIATTAAHNHSVKARVEGLKPHERYWYRFETRGEHSPVGRFQTALPPDSHAPVKFAFFSCADYTHGFYNAYERMAREDVNFVVCLVDYIYAETYHTRADGTGVRDDRTGRPASGENRKANDVTRGAVSLGDYRAKYALYRSDPHLRRLHANLPMVAMWDDHEVHPHTPPAVIDTLRSINPWVDQADFDHHGYAVVHATQKTFECTLKRMQTVKRRSTAMLPTPGFRYEVHRGQRSIKGVNGPPAS